MPRTLFLVLFTIQIILGFSTVFVVQHWDEAKLVDSVISQYYKGKILPTWYNYPSLIFNITYLDYWIWDLGIKRLIPNFNIFNRAIFYCISSIPSILIFKIFSKKKEEWLGLIISILFFSSWEFHYHSRWVAPDTIASTLGLASFYFLLSKKQNALLMAAILAALAFSTKYTAGIFFLPVIAKCIYYTKTRNLKYLCLLVLLFAITFVITSPGIFIHWDKAYADIMFEKAHYSNGHNGYTVNSFLIHFKKNLYYIIFILPSKSKIFSALLFIFITMGIIQLFKSKKWLLLLMLLIMLSYLIYISSQKVMFVRNLMLYWPLICILVGYGIQKTASFLHNKRLPYTIISLIAIYTLWLLAFSDIKIRNNKNIDTTKQLSAFINKKPHLKIWVSEGVGLKMKENNINYTNPQIKNGQIDLYAVYLYELIQWKLPCNNSGWINNILGAHEANIYYYTTYQGNNKIIITKDIQVLLNADLHM